MSTNPSVDALVAEVTEAIGAEDSATVLITGSAARLQALADQIKSQQMDADAAAAAVQAESDLLKAHTDPLAAAVAANPAP